MKFNRKKIVNVIASILAFILLTAWFVVAQPSCSGNSRIEATVSAEKLKEHVNFLSVDCYPRNFATPTQLEKAALYIEEDFTKSGLVVERQDVPARGGKFCNVIAHLNVGKGHKMIIGAHYDSCFKTPGADDNASGVAGLLELGRLLAKADLNYEIELVAYTLEEPPIFGGSQMGSAVHAKSIHNKNEKIEGVIVFEMIGYFSDKFLSQKYPVPLLYLYYPFNGNFITVVGSMGQREFTKSVKIGMQGSTDLPVCSINAPTSLPGIDFSDHRNYWLYDYQAVMITDTAFYRNTAYHKAEDTLDRLDYERMGQVVLSVFQYLKTK